MADDVYVASPDTPGTPGTAHLAAADPSRPGERLLGRRILIVEDEALLALELEFAFSDEAAEIIGPAFSLSGAVALLGCTAEIDGAVLDVDLAGVDVFPAAHLLQQRGVPIVFHTGHGTRAELGALFPGAAVCGKPTLPGELIAILRRMMR